MYAEVLQQIGFTQGEVKVYLALLEIGNSSTGAIIKNSKIRSCCCSAGRNSICFIVDGGTGIGVWENFKKEWCIALQGSKLAGLSSR